MERELKLELLQDHVERLIGLPVVSSCCVEPPHQDRLVSTYFDTPDLAFRQAHVSLRVRQAGEHYVQTLKTCGTQHGAFYEREEIVGLFVFSLLWTHRTMTELGQSPVLQVFLAVTLIAREPLRFLRH